MSSHGILRLFTKASALAVFFFSLSLYGSEMQAAQLSGIKGMVVIFDENGMARATTEGMAVLGEELVETAMGARVTVVFDDGGKVELGPSTRVKVNDLASGDGQSIFLYLGRVFCRIIPLKTARPSFTVHSLSTVAGVRGTDFEMAAGMDGGSLVSVESGEVELMVGEISDPVKSGEEAEISYDSKIRRGKRLPKDDAQWGKWMQARQAFFVQNIDQVAGVLTAKIDRSRSRISEQDARMAQAKKVLAAYYQQGKLPPEKLREQVGKQIDIYMKLMDDLSRADNTLLAVNYVVNRANEQVMMNPGAYSPDFTAKVKSTRDKLTRMDVAKVHRQNRQSIRGHFAGVMKAARKWDLQDRVWKDLPPRTRQKMMQRWQEQESKQSPQELKKQPSPRQSPAPKRKAKGQR